MSTRARVLAGMAIWRAVATERGAAILTGPQVDPLRADLDALVTLAVLRMFYRFDRPQVRTRVVRHDRPSYQAPGYWRRALITWQRRFRGGGRESARAEWARWAAAVRPPASRLAVAPAREPSIAERKGFGLPAAMFRMPPPGLLFAYGRPKSRSTPRARRGRSTQPDRVWPRRRPWRGQPNADCARRRSEPRRRAAGPRLLALAVGRGQSTVRSRRRGLPPRRSRNQPTAIRSTGSSSPAS